MLLLPFGAREIIAIVQKLQIREPRKSGGSPKPKRRRHDQQTDLRAAEIHSRTPAVHSFNSILPGILQRAIRSSANLLGQAARLRGVAANSLNAETS
jgi:hypothetical protein